MNIFVGSLPFSLQEADLKESFEAYGSVDSVKIIMDKFTGRSKGYGFVEMPNDDEANNAIGALNGATVGGRTIVVNKSEPRPQGQGERRSFNNNRGNDRGGYNDRGGFGGGNRGGYGGGNRGGY